MSVQLGSENAHAYDDIHGWGQHAIPMQKSTGPPKCCFQQRSDGVYESTFASKHRRKRGDQRGDQRRDQRRDQRGVAAAWRRGPFLSGLAIPTYKPALS
jgi:hypothetical protein